MKLCAILIVVFEIFLLRITLTVVIVVVQKCRPLFAYCFSVTEKLERFPRTIVR